MTLGPSEIFVVVLVILLSFGGKRLPEVARNLGRGIAEVRRYTVDMKRQLNSDFTESPPQKTVPSKSEADPIVKPSAQTNVNPAAQPRTPQKKSDATD
jgi:TatA/E family protein of Tat protein translocase